MSPAEIVARFARSKSDLDVPDPETIAAFYAAEDAREGRIYGGLTEAEADEQYQAWLAEQSGCLCGEPPSSAKHGTCLCGRDRT